VVLNACLEVVKEALGLVCRVPVTVAELA
jgi:hypothetical protein